MWFSRNLIKQKAKKVIRKFDEKQKTKKLKLYIKIWNKMQKYFFNIIVRNLYWTTLNIFKSFFGCKVVLEKAFFVSWRNFDEVSQGKFHVGFPIKTLRTEKLTNFIWDIFSENFSKIPMSHKKIINKKACQIYFKR